MFCYLLHCLYFSALLQQSKETELAAFHYDYSAEESMKPKQKKYKKDSYFSDEEEEELV